LQRKFKTDTTLAHGIYVDSQISLEVTGHGYKIT